jgi:hypothetical protein
MIKLKQLTSSLQDFWLEIFDVIDYMIFEILSKTQITQRIDFILIKIVDESLNKSKKYITRVEKVKNLEYNLQSQHFATNLLFTQPHSKLFYKTKII